MLDAVVENGADAFLLFNHEYSGQPGTKYISGFSGSESVLILSKKGNFIFTDGRYFSQVREECPDFKLMPRERFSFAIEFEKINKELGLKKVLVDTARTKYSSVLKFNEAFKEVSIIGSESILQKLRVVKDDTEISKIEKANEIAKKSFKEFLPEIKEGITEKELVWKLEKIMRENGAEKISFDTIVASGENGAKPHAKPSDKKIAKGELITIDFGCYFDGYASDITRTVALGEVSGKLRDIYEVVMVSQGMGLATAKAGISGFEIDKICRDYLSGKGYGEYFLHGTGHGLGMEVHELPYVSAGNKESLPENSVITVEPGIYIEGVGGVRIEDDVVLKKGGNINLSGELSRDLIVL